MNSISFEDSQLNVGDNYYIYIEDGNAHVSCYFWFDSLAQSLLSIKEHCDFWQWGNGLEQAKHDLSNIIDSQLPTAEFDDELMSQINAYMQEHAGICLYSWGAFEELCSGSDDFSKEVRTEFREECANSYDEYDPEYDEDSEDEDLASESRPISEEEMEDFCAYLINMPS
jgi:hypothetical protein